KPDIWIDPAYLQRIADDISRESGEPVEATSALLALGLQSGSALSTEHELTHIRKDGSSLPGALSVTALRDGAGEITGYVGILRDNTTRREAEAAMRQAKEAAEAAHRAKAQFVAHISPAV